MIARYAKPILLVTGLVTLSPLLAFLLPASFQSISQLDVTGDAALLFLRHWGIEVACVGGLLLYAAFHPAARVPILVAAIVGKGAMVWLLLAGWSNPALAGMRVTLYFDAACVLLYVLILLSGRTSGAAGTR